MKDQKEINRLLNELEKLTTDLNFPKHLRRNYRWLARRALLIKIRDTKYKRIVDIIKQLHILNNDCYINGFVIDI